MKVAKFGIVTSQQCYHNNPENKRHAMEVHTNSVFIQDMLAKYVNCFLNVSHSRHVFRTLNNKEADRRYTVFTSKSKAATCFGCTN